MLKELIKLANTLDSKGLTKDADILDRIIRDASDSLPLRDNPVTGAKRQFQGCRPGDESSYCKKMRHFMKTFNGAVTGKSFYREHLLKRGFGESYVDDWGHEIWAKKALDPNNLFGFGEDVSEEDLHETLIYIAERGGLGYIPDYERKQRQVEDKRIKNSDYGNFISDLLGSITNATLRERGAEIYQSTIQYLILHSPCYTTI